MTTKSGGQGIAAGHGSAKGGRTYVVHLGTLTLKYDESPVAASQILTAAGFTPPEDYTLEALKGAQGPAEQEFASSDMVPLDESHARHFRAVPRGGGRA